MIDVARRAGRRRARSPHRARSGRPCEVLVGTVSHCHGALSRVVVAAEPPSGIAHSGPRFPSSQRRFHDIGDGGDRRAARWTRGTDWPRPIEYDVVIIGAGPAGMCAGMYAGRAHAQDRRARARRSRRRAAQHRVDRGLSGLRDTSSATNSPRSSPTTPRSSAPSSARRSSSSPCETARRRPVRDAARSRATSIESPAVIVTAGGTPVKLGIPGEIEYAGKGVSYCAICDGAFFRGHTIAVVGGGDAATEEADFLTRYADKVYLIHRRDELRASKILQQRAVRESEDRSHLEHRRRARRGRRAGAACTHSSCATSRRARRAISPATGLFVFVGFRPNTGIIDGHVDHDDMRLPAHRREHADEHPRALRRGRRARRSSRAR